MEEVKSDHLELNTFEMDGKLVVVDIKTTKLDASAVQRQMDYYKNILKEEKTNERN